MTQFPDLFAALAAPFDPHEVKSRTQGGAKLSYITARTAMNRLDDVLGPENWWDKYEAHENSVLCRLTIRLPDGSQLVKEDAGGYAGMADSGDDDKSGYSDAFKRACVKFGVSRYLYRDGVPEFVRERESIAGSEQREPTRESRPARQEPPRQEERRQEAPQNGHANGHQSNGNGRGQSPKTGRALFAWTKEQEQKHECSLLRYLNEFIKLNDFPSRMVDLDESQVGMVHAEACRKIESLTAGGVR